MAANKSDDSDFLKFEFVDTLLRAVGIEQEYAFSDQIRDKYFHEEQIGNLTAMTPGAIDVSKKMIISNIDLLNTPRTFINSLFSPNPYRCLEYFSLKPVLTKWWKRTRNMEKTLISIPLNTRARNHFATHLC